MFNNNAIGNSLNPIFSPGNNIWEDRNPPSNSTWPLAPSMSSIDQVQSTINRIDPSNRQHSLRPLYSRRNSHPLENAVQIDRLLRSKYGLQFIDELPNLSEISANIIRSALKVLEPCSPNEVSSLKALINACTSKNLQQRSLGFESALILMKYRIIDHQKCFIRCLGPTMFEVALQYCNEVSIISRMLNQHNIDINDVNLDGDTSLHLAARYNSNPEIVTLLINAGSLLHEKNHDGKTPMQLAAMKNRNPEVIASFIKCKGDINQHDDRGNNLLHLAIASGNMNMIKFLANNGVNIHKKNSNKYTPLRLAVKNPLINENTIQFLIQKIVPSR